VPGATSNQPPVPATAPSRPAPQPLQAAQNGGGGNSRREAVTNYEVDKTVRVTRNATGNVKRLNAAVVVNHRSVTDPKGKTTHHAAGRRKSREADRAGAGGIGFNKERGDSVRVINAPFKVDPCPSRPTADLEAARGHRHAARAAVPAGLWCWWR
jgi:flagellar M-ring protein FliF